MLSFYRSLSSSVRTKETWVLSKCYCTLCTFLRKLSKISLILICIYAGGSIRIRINLYLFSFYPRRSLFLFSSSFNVLHALCNKHNILYPSVKPSHYYRSCYKNFRLEIIETHLPIKIKLSAIIVN